MTLPNEPGGFAVNLVTAEVHKRHADHARLLRRSTRAGTEALLSDRKPKLCTECFIPPKPTKPQRKSRDGKEAAKVLKDAGMSVKEPTATSLPTPITVPKIDEAMADDGED